MALPRIANAPLYWICLALLAIALIDLRWFHVFEFADHQLSDALVKIRAQRLEADPDVVVIDIDDRALAGMNDVVGRFPWPRSVYGELVTELEKQRAKAIVFDVEFYEKDIVRPEQDDVFNEAIAPTRNTFFSMQWLDKIGPEDGTPVADVAAALDLPTTGTPNPTAKLPLLLPKAITPKAWSRAGSINFNEDADGVGRGYDLWRDYEGWLIPSLPARVAKALGYPVPDERSMLLSWLEGGQFPHPRVSFYDIYAEIQNANRRRSPTEFKNKIVVVGSTASGLHDFRNTPVSALMPGVEILATAIDNLRRGLFLRQAPPSTESALVAISFLMLLFALARRWNVVQIFGLLVAGTAVLVGASYVALSQSILLPVGVPLLFAWVFFFCAALLAYVRELRERARTDAKTVASLPANATVDLVKREGAWVQLRSGKDLGWAKLFDVRLAGAQTAPAKNGNVLGDTVGLMTGQRGASVTTGVRGLDEDMLQHAVPNLEQYKLLVSYASTKEQAKAFAKAGNLQPRTVEELK